jgi:hypothetical protein
VRLLPKLRVPAPSPARRRRRPRPDAPRTIVAVGPSAADAPFAARVDAARDRLRNTIPAVGDD